MIHLLVLIVVNSFTLIALSVLLIRTIWSLGAGTTAIEVWEIERHETLLRRARVLGGYLDGPDGIKVKIQKQEFPYDIGIWRNFKQGMGGTGNVRMPTLHFVEYCALTTFPNRYSSGSGPLQLPHIVTQD